MRLTPNIQFGKWLRHGVISSILLVIVVLAFASKGGGGDKKNAPVFKDDFTPIHAIGAFSLKTGISYKGNYSFNQQKTNDKVSLSTIVTYQRGHSIYIMPYTYKMNAFSLDNAATPKSNLQLLGFRFKMPK